MPDERIPFDVTINPLKKYLSIPEYESLADNTTFGPQQELYGQKERCRFITQKEIKWSQ